MERSRKGLLLRQDWSGCTSEVILVCFQPVWHNVCMNNIWKCICEHYIRILLWSTYIIHAMSCNQRTYVQSVLRSGQSKGSSKWVKAWFSILIALHGAIRSAIHIVAHFYPQTVVQEWMCSLHVGAIMTWASQRTLYINGWGSIHGLQIIHTTFESRVILHGNVSQRRGNIQTIHTFVKGLSG